MARQVLAVFVGTATSISELCGGTHAVQEFERAGYACATLDLTDALPLEVGDTLQILAQRMETTLRNVLPSRLHRFVDERYWHTVVLCDEPPSELRNLRLVTTTRLAFAVTWDGTLISGNDVGRSLGTRAVYSALVHWYAVGSLGEAAREASGTGDDAARVRIRHDLEQATVLLDPRIDVYWEDEHVVLDEVRAAWRTTEMEGLTARVVNSLDHLISSRRTRRLGTTVLLLTMINSVGVLTTLIDFSVSNTSSTPRNVVRVVVGLFLLGGSLGAWWTLRDRGPSDEASTTSKR